MALTREQKEAQVKELTEKMSGASSVILAHYIGLSVAEISELRNQLKESEAEMKVAKKTLMKLATEQAGLPDISTETLEGPVSLIFSFGDPLSGAQIAFKYSKDHKQVELIGGVYDGKLLSKEEAVELAKMPNRDELLTIFARMIRSPLVSFASMCGSPLTGFARALSELAEKKSSEVEVKAEPAEVVPARTPQSDGEDKKEEAAPEADAAIEQKDEKPEEPKAEAAPEPDTSPEQAEEKTEEPEPEPKPES